MDNFIAVVFIIFLAVAMLSLLALAILTIVEAINSAKENREWNERMNEWKKR